MMTAPSTNAPAVGVGASASSAGQDDVSLARRRRHPVYLIGTVLVSVVLAQIVWFVFTNPKLQWGVVWDYLFAAPILRGLRMTLILTALGMLIGIGIGIITGLARMSSFAPLRVVAMLYSRLFLGVPLLVQLIFWYNLGFLVPEISIGIPFGPTFHSWETNALISGFSAALLGLGLHEGAYMSEVVRAGLLSVDAGQRDAANALGMTGPQSFTRIVLPQAMRFVIPPTANQVIAMLKGTSLVSVIALGELLHAVSAVYDRTFQVIPLLLVACVWYLAVIGVLEIIQRQLERHFSRGFGASSAPARRNPMGRKRS